MEYFIFTGCYVAICYYDVSVYWHSQDLNYLLASLYERNTKGHNYSQTAISAFKKENKYIKIV